MRDRLFLLFILLGLVFGLNFLNNARQKETCANSISCIKDLSGKFEEGQGDNFFMGKKITPPSLFAKAEPILVLGQSNEPKRIEVDLAKQRLYAFEGERKVFETPVSTGKWAPTPTGTFKIWVKLVRTRMSGGEGNDYYNLANVPHVMFFYNEEVGQGRGFSLHGAYWHNNFGHPMSHGCVNLPLAAAETLFQWADPPTDGDTTYATKENPGTKVIIYGKPPKE